MLTYAGVHAFYTIPLIIALTFVLRRYVYVATEVNKITLLSTIAFTYTMFWDNYIVAMGAWTYPPERVLAVIGYVPVEEYAFFIIQTAITSLACLAISRWDLQVLHLKPATRIVRVAPIALFLITTATGFAFAIPQSKTFYVGALLAWTGPVLALQWWVAGPFIWSYRHKATLAIVVPTLYLWWVDHTAIKHGVWEISNSGTLGILVTPYLPIEEALFFFIVNCMIIFGLLAIDRTLTILRLEEAKIGGRGDRVAPFHSLKEQNGAIMEKWTVLDEVKTWIRYTLMHESAFDLRDISNYLTLEEYVKDISPALTWPIKLLPQMLREDALTLHGLYIVLHNIENAKSSETKKLKSLHSLNKFMEGCYSPCTSATAHQSRLEISLEILRDEIDTLVPIAILNATMYIFARRIVATVPFSCFSDLIAGYEMSITHQRVVNEQDLIAFSNAKAGPIGRAMVYLMNRYSTVQQGGLKKIVDVVNDPYVQPSITQMTIASKLAISWHLKFLAHGLKVSQKEGGRTVEQHHIPQDWLSEMCPTDSFSNSFIQIEEKKTEIRSRHSADGGDKPHCILATVVEASKKEVTVMIRESYLELASRNADEAEEFGWTTVPWYFQDAFNHALRKIRAP
ncbi:hypothetical protein BC830DRAFT_1230540 [Chytriomyces sp. MP71]|nr:hypothetical protein BC830DRAFT_1230540 [Chytriomyces sp. MP71]